MDVNVRIFWSRHTQYAARERKKKIERPREKATRESSWFCALVRSIHLTNTHLNSRCIRARYPRYTFVHVYTRVRVFVCVKSNLLRFHVDGERGECGERRTEEAAMDEWMNLKTVMRETHPRNRERAFERDARFEGLRGFSSSSPLSWSWALCALRDCTPRLWTSFSQLLSANARLTLSQLLRFVAFSRFISYSQYI